MSSAQARVPSREKQSQGPEMGQYLDNELYSLCEEIRDNGKPVSGGSRGMASIRFIELFKFHSVVSNRLLNVLIRARKGGFIDFKGELLLQGKDDDEVVTLIKMPPKSVQLTKTNMVKV